MNACHVQPMAMLPQGVLPSPCFPTNKEVGTFGEKQAMVATGLLSQSVGQKRKVVAPRKQCIVGLAVETSLGEG